MRNTPEQDLAWERWQKCSGSPHIRLKEIRTNGETWVSFANGAALAEWQACDRYARQEQRTPARVPKTPERQQSESPDALRLVAEAKAYEAQGRVDDAILKYGEALKVLPAVDATTAYRIMRQMQLLYSKTGQDGQAIDIAERQLRLLERVGQIPIGDGTFWRPSSVLVELSWHTYRQGAFRDSLRYAEAAYARREQDRPVPALLASILARRGLARVELFDAELALPDFQEALRLTEGSQNVRFIANQHHNLGNAHFSIGNYQLAITSLEKAISIGRGLSASPDLPIHLATLGRVYGHLNAFDMAHRYLDEAVQLARSMNDATLLQNGLRRKGQVYRWQGDYASALGLANQALALAQARRHVSAEGWLRLEIGFIQSNQGEHTRAQESFRMARQVSEQVANPILAAFATSGMVFSYIRTGDYAAAESTFQTIESVLERLGTTSYTWRVWYAKGQLREAQGRLEEAFDSYAEAIRQVETLRIRLPTAERRATFIEDKQDAYEAIVRVLFRLGRVPAAFEYAERGKGRAFLDLLKQRRVKQRGSGAPRDLLADEAARLNEDIARRQAEMSRSSESQAVSTGALRRNAEELSAAESRWRDLEKQLKQGSLSYEGNAAWTPLTTAAIQRALQPTTGLVSYYLGKEDGWLFYIDRENVVGVRLNTARAAIERDVSALRSAIMARLGPNRAEASEWAQAAARLHETLVAPILVHAEKKAHLIVAPHRALHYLPFQVLIGGDGKALVERIATSVLPSASTLDLLTGGRSHRGRGLGVANPVIAGLGRLPGAEQEVLALDRFWPSDILMDRAATKASVVGRMQTPRIVHFATHAELDRFAPLQSSVRLTPTEDDDGRLTVDEIFDLEVTAELVVLAACDTGVGIGYKGETGAIREAQEEVFPPGDELVGLSRAFLHAGTPSLVATLWAVEDGATAKVMARLYANLRTMPKAEALRQAQLAFVRADRSYDTQISQLDQGEADLDGPKANVRLSHPYFWAGFILIGDGESSMRD